MRPATLSLALVLLVTACTVRTVGPEGTTSPQPAPSGGSGSAAPSPSGTSAPAPSGESSATPAEVVGSWTWVTSTGGQTLVFAPSGTFTSDTYLDAHPGASCGTEYLTHREGRAVFAGDALTLAPSVSRRKKTDSCKDAVLADETIENETTGYRWRLETDASSATPSLVLVGADAFEATYRRE